MGLLDDAIREHLELKRRGGADPADVARLEREAFGAQEQAAAPNGDAQAPEPPAGHADEPRPDPGDHVDTSDSPHPDENVHEPAAAGAIRCCDAESHMPPAEPRRTSASRSSSRRASSRPPSSRTPSARSARGRAAARPADAPDEDDEVHDELEETPDFLQETPEHDRLWFEQKPPRDFDF